MLKPYYVFSRSVGPEEGAYLVFAHTAQEARVVGWREGGSDLTDDYMDFAAKLDRRADWLFAEGDQNKLAADVPHLVWDIRSCKVCEQWGQSKIGEDGLCDDCREGD